MPVKGSLPVPARSLDEAPSQPSSEEQQFQEPARACHSHHPFRDQTHWPEPGNVRWITPQAGRGLAGTCQIRPHPPPKAQVPEGDRIAVNHIGGKDARGSTFACPRRFRHWPVSENHEWV